MEQNTRLSISPDMRRVYKYFYFLPLVDNDTKTRINASWGKIDSSDYYFLHTMFSSRKLKVNLDDVAFLYNYLKFIQRVKDKNPSFNLEGTKVEESEKELWPFFQMMEKSDSMQRISFVLENKDEVNAPHKPIKIKSEYALKLIHLILKKSIIQDTGMQYLQNNLLAMKKNGSLDDFLKKRSGNRIDYTESVMRFFVTSLKKYFMTEVKAAGKRRVPYNILTGEILNRIGHLEEFKDDGRYNNLEDYYSKKVNSQNLDTIISKESKMIDDLFPPHFLIYFNRRLI